MFLRDRRQGTSVLRPTLLMQAEVHAVCKCSLRCLLPASPVGRCGAPIIKAGQEQIRVSSPLLERKVTLMAIVKK